MTDFLFNIPSFLSGFASVIDIGGTLNRYNESRSPNEADVMALSSDFIAIGKDMRDAINTLVK